MLQSATAITWLLGPLPFRICFGCNEFLRLGKRWQEKLRGLVCSSISFLKEESCCTGHTARGVVLGHLPSLTDLEKRGKRERGSDPRCSGGEKSTRRPTAVAGKKAGGISQLILWSRRKTERG